MHRCGSTVQMLLDLSIPSVVLRNWLPDALPTDLLLREVMDRYQPSCSVGTGLLEQWDFADKKLVLVTMIQEEKTCCWSYQRG